MSISSSDISKHTLSSLPIRPEQRNSDNFHVRNQSEAKVVQTLSDTNKTNKEDSKEQTFSDKIEPNQVKQMNTKMAQLNFHLSFEMSKDSNEKIVKVIDQTTGDVVRQIPSEEFIKMSKRIDDIISQLRDIKGTIVNSKV
ncbi:flagellar protein FlaG [Marinomonas spartinae]|uniref:Flagellar protein FlaG n=1 Tax=Marinomonas spartinae TaxID=1792290 RepID=A0A1A8T6L0_9GAMM|nr:flagellar protein FlaG [Marinomonas spartinae]SBS28098.1 flagellar protein FlaG [Marinomonas spartinae]SBS28572.1 flagellar protein FlaG [Marinomonas spartinae]